LIFIGCICTVYCYICRKSEATDVQAVNDFILFSVAGIGSLASGAIYSSAGWFVLIYVVTGMMFFNIILFSVAWTLKKVIDDAVENAEDEEGDASTTGPGGRDNSNTNHPPLHTTYNSLLGELDAEATPQSPADQGNGNRDGRTSSRSSSKSYTDHFMMPTPTDVDETEIVRSISVA